MTKRAGAHLPVSSSILRSLAHNLLCEAPNHIRVQHIWEPQHQLLHARVLVCRDLLTNRSGTANQCSTTEKRLHSVRNFRLSQFISIPHETDRSYRAMNALVITS